MVPSADSVTRRGARALALLIAVVPTLVQAQSPTDPFGVFASRPPDAQKALADSSAAFVANKGQWDAEALFLSRTKGVDSWVVPTGVVFDFYQIVQDPEVPTADLLAEFERAPKPYGVTDEAVGRRMSDPRRESRLLMEQTRRVGHVVRMAFQGAAPSQQPEGQGIQQGHFNYYVGRDSARWATIVPRYTRAIVRNLYPGIDAVYYVDGGAPRYDLVVRPGADPSRIRFALVGAESVRTTRDGRLAFGTRFGEFEMRDLKAFQGSRTVRCSLAVSHDGTVGFELGSYDRSKPLTIDPLVSSTFLGGSGGISDSAYSVAVDASGNAVVSGRTRSADFPTTAGPYVDRTLDGQQDGFVAWLNASGWLLSSTFLGGGDWDQANAVAVDPSGNAVVCGETHSANFPTTPGLYVDSKLDGSGDAFVARLNPMGWLLSSTFLGGGSWDQAYGIAVDGAGNAVVCGDTYSADFPTTAGLYVDRRLDGLQDAFVARLNSLGWLLSSTYLGGTAGEHAAAVAVDASGNAVVCGETHSADFPTTAGAYVDRKLDGLQDAFVARFNSQGWLLSSTFLGGAQLDEGLGIAVDSSGNAVVCGQTDSADFPTTAGAYVDRTYDGNGDAFVARINALGWLLSSTYLGGDDSEAAYGVGVDGSGNATVCGYTRSARFPTTVGIFDQTYNGGGDVVVARLNASGWLLASTFLGGSEWDAGFGVAVDLFGNAVVVGETQSAGFPTSEGPYIDRTLSGLNDVFVSRLSFSP